MATISELVTRFGFEIDDKGLKDLQEGIDAVKDGVLSLGAALVGEAVGLYELVAKSAEAAISMSHMSQETGIAVENLDRLRFMAKLTGVSTEELGQSINILSRNLTMAKQGSEEVRKHFRLLGFTTGELRSGSLKVDDVLNRLGGRFNKLKDGPEKTGLAMEVFGRGGARMVPFLNKLNQELDPVNKSILGLYKITEKEVEISGEFHAELSVLQSAIVKIGQVVAFGFMPAVTAVIKQIKLWVVQNREMIKTNLTQFVMGMTAALKLTLKITDALVQAFSGFAHTIGGVRIATELFLAVFALLSASSILFGIGKVVQAVVDLGNAFAVTNLKAVLVPVAIGAAMIALLLIMEDIFSFFSGKNSFTGDLLKKLPQIGEAFRTTFEPIFEPMVALMTMLTDGFSSWKDIFRELGTLIVNTLLLPLRGIVSVVGGLATTIGQISGSETLKKLGASELNFADKLKADFTAGGAIGVTPQAAVGASSSTSNNSTSSVKNDVKVTNQFNFPAGTDPAKVGDKISTSVSDGLDAILRNTQNSSSVQGVY